MEDNEVKENVKNLKMSTRDDFNNSEETEKTNEIKANKKMKIEPNGSEMSVYDKYYKLLFFISIIALAVSLIYIYSFYSLHGDILKKDITLSGGTSVQVQTASDINDLKNALAPKFSEVNVRQISDIITGEQIAIVVETSVPPEEIVPFLEEYFNFKLDETNSSIEFTGSSLSGSFYNQLKIALILSFVAMAIVVFIIFRTPIPSLAVIFAAFADITMTLAVVNFLGMSVSTAGIVAFIMLIGYSVDTDILLTIRVLKRHEGSINSRVFSSFKTGITMTLTSLVVNVIGMLMMSSISNVFAQIFTILTIGLLFDILNTWIFNASLIKWYAERRNK